MIHKKGFKIDNGKIYDTKIVTYELKRMFMDNNIIYYLKEYNYKRLYLFEPLLEVFSKEKVFELLIFNEFLKKQRVKESNVKETILVNMSNYAMLTRFPPTYLNAKKFSLYKKCRYLMNRLD